MLKFDDQTTKLLERAYTGRDFVRRRHANIAALAPVAGEVIVDLGCGNGMLLPELDNAMGGAGRIVGVDPSEPMLRAARTRTDGTGTVELKVGDASAIPLPDGSVDGIVSIQVFEYIADIPAALAECRRVLRPGGRLVIGDMDFSTLAWAATDPDLMERVQRTWDAHFEDPIVPQRLPGMLPGAGFEPAGVTPVHVFDTERRADGLARMMQTLMSAFAVTQGMPEAEAKAWSDDLDHRAANGTYYYSIVHGITAARAV